MKLTITIGIPTYNESANIAQLVKSLLKQKRSNFSLDRILIVDDCSKDKTQEILKKLSKQHSRVSIILGKKRLGKNARMLQLFSKTKSDYIVLFDADVYPKDEHVCENMVAALKGKNVGIVSGNDQPVAPNGFMQHITVATELLWNAIRQAAPSTDMAHNCRARVLGLSQDFMRVIQFPDNMLLDDYYLYMLAMEQNFIFKYVSSAVVRYITPNNYHETITQFLRYPSQTIAQQVADLHLNNEVYIKQHIPFSNKIHGIKLALSSNFFYTTLSLFLLVWVRILLYTNSAEPGFTWDEITSTKLEFSSKRE